MISGGKEKLKHVAKALGPGGFVVNGALGLQIGEVFSDVPAAVDEGAFEQLGIAEGADAFGGSDVEPDPQVARLGGSAVDHVEDAALIPP